MKRRLAGGEGRRDLLSTAFAAAAGLALLLGPVQAQASPATYRVTDLGALGDSGDVYGINDMGQVVGAYTTADGISHAAMWNTAGGSVTRTDLSTLGGASGATFGSAAFGINNAGQVVGRSETPGGYLHAALWNTAAGGAATDLETAGHPFSTAYAINSTGQVAGYAFASGDGSYHPTLWDPVAGQTDLGTLGGNAGFARAINDQGQVAGYSTLADNSTNRATVWPPQGGQDLGTLGGTTSEAYGMNNLGQTVGFSNTPGDADMHATLWDAAGSPTDLGTILGTHKSFAYDINDAGLVVGAVNGSVDVAVIWTAADGMHLLAQLIDPSDPLYQAPGRLNDAWSVNESGQIVVAGFFSGSGRHGYLFTPVEAVPEPAALELMVAGLALVGSVAGRRRG